MSEAGGCRVCTFDSFFGDDEDHSPQGAAAPNLLALRDQIRLELQESQRKFAAEMEKKLKEALNADAKFNLSMSARSQVSSGRQPETARDAKPWWQIQNTESKQGAYKYLSMKPVETEPTEEETKWSEQWLEEVENGELDVYTCLGLSNCFSLTPDTRKILAKAIAVTFLQMVVPFCLLTAETNIGIELGPAEGDFGFRLVGFTLYGYAIYCMYQGADGHCRTLLLNVMFQYDHIPLGHWLPLMAGEISNIFTAVVLIVALYSIFTTQTQPPDLILNAVAVNFLCDCDGSFVDSDMKADALETFKTFTHTLFTTQRSRYESPYHETCPAKIVKVALFFISIAGVAGCFCFMLYPSHAGGNRDTTPGFSHHVVKFIEGANNTFIPESD